MSKNGKQATELSVAVFDKNELIANAKEFNTKPEIMAGALVSIKNDRISKQEAADALQKYVSRKIGKE